MSFPNTTGSEKYVIPALTGVIEIYTGVEADLIGTFWHLCKGQDVDLGDGEILTLPNMDNRYIRFTENENRTVQQIAYAVSQPNSRNEDIKLVGGAHRHDNADRNWLTNTSRSGSHSHNFQVRVPLRQTSTGTGDWRGNGNVAARVVASNGTESGDTWGESVSNFGSTWGMNSARHNHTISYNAHHGNNQPDHTHKHNVESDAETMVLDGTQYYYVMFIDGVRYNG